MISPITAISAYAARQNTTIDRYLVARSLNRPAGTVSSVRSVPSPASPATESPETTATASGTTTGSSTKMANSARNTPLSAIWPTKTPGPSPPDPGDGVLIFSTTPRKIGAAPSSASIARLRGLRKMILISERKNRSQCRTAVVLAPGRLGVTWTALAVDIEAFTSQLDEQVFQAGTHRLKPGDRDARMDELSVDLLRSVLAKAGADLPVGGRDVGKAKRGEHVGRRARVGGADQDPRLASAAQLRQRALEHQRSRAHDPDVRADLIDLGQQVRRDEDRGPISGYLLNQRPDLAGALRVKAVGRLVEHHKLSRPQQAGGDAEPLLHAEGVGAVSLAGSGEQADLVERVVDPGRRCVQVGGRIGGVAPGQVLPTGQERVERRTLDQRAHSR